MRAHLPVMSVSTTPGRLKALLVLGALVSFQVTTCKGAKCYCYNK